jgi:hypothetical protein
MADAGQAPRADQSLGDQPFKNRADMFDKGSVKRHPQSGGGPSRTIVRIGYDIRMQEEQIETIEAQPAQASFDRTAQNGLDLTVRRLAQIAFAGDAHPIGQPSGKGRADDLLGLAVAIARRQVEQVDAGFDRRMHGRDAFVECGLAPNHAEPAAAQSQRRNRPESPQVMPLHDRPPKYRRSSSPILLLAQPDCIRPRLDRVSRRLLNVAGGSGRVAQRESTPFTRVGSQVQSLSRPPALSTTHTEFELRPGSVSMR